MKEIKAIICTMLAMFMLLLTGCSDEQASHSSTSSTDTKQAVQVEGSSDQEEDHSPSKANREDVVGEAATVERVVDGDTLKVKMLNGKRDRVRLLLVDTPETKHPKLGVQPFGPEASAYTKKRLEGQEITLEFDVQERDQYGRLLAYVWIDNELYNEELLAKGLARVAVFPPNTKYVDEFKKIQEQARKSEKGIWSIENYAQEKGYNTDVVKNQSSSNQKDTQSAKSCEGKIKGNQNSKIYHVPTGAHYNQTMNNVIWFCTEKDAQEAGYTKAKN
ncbi:MULTISPECIES: thermonuclease family protein [Priestia]|uniref:thermonuclease family protein n=1 Tax=Priestia TaxID=2800373 RepID=UPI0018739FF5|nr:MULTISPECIES: thermonuclease family protein [Priestia]MBE5098122.1 thermonuclease family protein [Priestia aryabhattai]MCM3541934.1 thermonuclease family protein [Priestia megaterium]